MIIEQNVLLVLTWNIMFHIIYVYKSEDISAKECFTTSSRNLHVIVRNCNQRRFYMEHYNLDEDEVVLYKGDVVFKEKTQSTQIVLTNKNLVFINVAKKLFAHDEIETQIYPVNEIKMYEGVPQVKAQSNEVEIYLKTKELEFGFQSKNEVYKFRSAIIKLLTGKTGFERGADKVKDKIDVVNDTFGVDVVKSTEDVVKNGIVESIGGLFEKVGKIGKVIFGKKK